MKEEQRMSREKVKVTFMPDDKSIYVGKGISILKASELAGITISSLCGGRGLCGKCKVQVSGVDKSPSAAELKLLSQDEIKMGVRLACSFPLEEDTVVIIPNESREKRVSILQEGLKLGEFHLQSDLSKVYMEVEQPTLYNQSSDLERLERALRERGFAPVELSGNLIRELPEKIRSSDYSLTAAIIGNKVISLEKGDTTQKAFGVAIDIGTTTLVGYLMDLNSGRQISVASKVNPQRIYGSDVMSRAAQVSERPELIETMQALVISAINEIIDHLISDSGVEEDYIYKMTIVGNTCMQHLFLGVSPKYLALAPYSPVFSRAIRVSAKELGLHINPDGYVHLLPSLAGFVGADTMGMILSTLIHRSDKIKLAIDLGTNGEIVLGSKDGLTACSAAAGPAFEGEHIQCGMIAAPGAIDRVIIHDDVYIHTIGDAPSIGICGSGLIDAIAEMRKAGIIHERGRLICEDETKFIKRFKSGKDGNQFVISYGSEKNKTPPVVITQADVEEFQLAKAAISAGVQILMEEMGVVADDISQVFIAGAFGNYIRRESFCDLGIIPEMDMEQITPVGNAAGEGAKIALVSSKRLEEANSIAKKVRYIELSAHPSFRKRFIHSMFFLNRRFEDQLGIMR